MKTFGLFLSLLISMSAHAQLMSDDDVKKTPEQIYIEAANQLGTQAWLTYQQKLLQLLDTYFPRTDESGSFVEYTTENDDACPEGNRPGVVYAMYLHREKTKSSNSIMVDHHACGWDKIEEYIRVEGSGEYHIDSLKLIIGERPFVAPEGQKSLDYLVRSPWNETYFRIIERNEEDYRKFVMFIGNDKLAEFDYNKKTKEALFSAFPVDEDWRFGRTGRWRYRHDRGRSGMIAYEGSLGTTLFLGAESGKDWALNDFRFFLNFFISEAIVGNITKQFEALNQHFLPKSEFSSAGSADEELIEDLRELVVRLQSGDTQTVLNELLKLIQDAENAKLRRF